MLRLLSYSLVMLCLTACVTTPTDPARRWMEPGEDIRLRIAARLLHGHDMLEPAYDAPEGYRPIPTYEGELLLTDRRLLFLDGSAPSMLSIPFEAIARSRPSQTALLNYLVVWDHDGKSESFVVDGRDVRSLHRQFGQAMLLRQKASGISAPHPSVSQSAVKDEPSSPGN